MKTRKKVEELERAGKKSRKRRRKIELREERRKRS